MMLRADRVWPAIIWASAGLTAIMAIIGGDYPLRHIVAMWFLLVCPGMALVRLLGIEDRLTAWTLAVVLSLAINAFVAMFMIYTGIWRPAWGFSLVFIIAASAAWADFTAAARERALEEALAESPAAGE